MNQCGNGVGGERPGAIPWHRRTFQRARVLALVSLVMFLARPAPGYSLLTHEELVDIAWKDQIEPLLLKRFPAARPGQLRRAHAYAYGGCLIQDIGYYPFGSRFESDLSHYVRTGDLVSNLIQESNDLDQYAFALGALRHYSADRCGHPLINRAVGLAFPKLSAEYGQNVTYEEDPKAHIRTEFGFDITQVAKHRYTSDQYHDFIGFEISRPLLQRACLKTYGLPLEEVMPHVDLAIGTFRRAVSLVIPEMTQAALTVYHPENVKDPPNADTRLFRYNLSCAQYEKEWGTQYRKPNFFARVLGFMLRYIPKIGVFKALDFKIPGPQMEDLYLKSVNSSVAEYEKLLRQVGEGNLQFPNVDCDTGRPTCPGEYALADATYARLLEALFRRGYQDLPPGLREHLLAFYDRAEPPQHPRKARKAWRRTALEVEALRAGPGSPSDMKARALLLRPLLRLESPKAKGEHDTIPSAGSRAAT